MRPFAGESSAVAILIAKGPWGKPIIPGTVLPERHHDSWPCSPARLLVEGHGQAMLTYLYQLARERESVFEITVEDPSPGFQKVRSAESLLPSAAVPWCVMCCGHMLIWASVHDQRQHARNRRGESKVMLRVIDPRAMIAAP